MVCNVCGAINEEGARVCRVCAKPLPEESGQDVGPRFVSPPQDEDGAEGQSGWSFARAPRWPKPSFDAQSITPDELRRAAEAPPEPPPAPEPPPVSRQGGQAYRAAPRPEAQQPQRPANRPRPVPLDDGFDDFFEDSVRRRPAAQDDIDFDDEFDVPPRPARGAQPYQQRPAAARPPSRGYARPPSSRRRPSSRGRGRGMSSRGKNVLFWAATAALCLVVVLLLVSLFTKNSGGLPALFGSIFNSSPITRDPVTEKTAEGNFLFKIYAKNGATVRLRIGTEEYDAVVKGGLVSFNAPPSSWYPAEPVESSPLMVTPDFTVITEDGTQTKVEIEPVAIDLPAVTVTLTAPTAPVTTGDGVVAVTGTVSDPMAQVVIGTQALSVALDGSFSGTYQLTQQGEQTITVEGRKPGAVIGKATITANYTGEVEPPPTPNESSTIVLAQGSALRGTTATFKVSGTMEAGSTVTVTGAVQSGSVQFDSNAGTFSFTASVPEVGYATATVTATKNGVATAKDFHLEHAPDLAAYSQAAFRMDYAAIKADPTQDHGYKCVGTITQVIQTGEKVLAKLNVGSDQILVIEYHPNYASAASIETGDGKTYSIFAFPNGTYDDNGTTLPLMYAWFVLKS